MEFSKDQGCSLLKIWVALFWWSRWLFLRLRAHFLITTFWWSGIFFMINRLTFFKITVTFCSRFLFLRGESYLFRALFDFFSSQLYQKIKIKVKISRLLLIFVGPIFKDFHLILFKNQPQNPHLYKTTPTYKRSTPLFTKRSTPLIKTNKHTHPHTHSPLLTL